MTRNIPYIECAGVNVPSGWTVEQLRDALAERKIRFHNEQEVIEVFGDAVSLKARLEDQIQELQSKKLALEAQIRELEHLQ